MITNKKIGIWGFGIVGQSALRFLSRYTHNLSVLDKGVLQKTQDTVLKSYPFLTVIHEQSEATIINFLQTHDLIVASPGIDIKRYQQFQHTFITELDIFFTFFKKPVIAITGSIGKTSLTTLLTALINARFSARSGGNIGLGMLDLIEQQNTLDYAVLELSSFQLEYARLCKPELAVLTNFYPNHLDRHGNVEQYFLAKMKLFADQDHHQKALLPLEIITNAIFKKSCSVKNPHFFTAHRPPATLLEAVENAPVFWQEDGYIVRHEHNNTKHLIACSSLPDIGFASTWVALIAALDILKIPLSVIENVSHVTPQQLEHRLELVRTVNGITFYNDSKATVPEATLAAVEKFAGKKIILFLGGLSKGIDRSILIKKLYGRVVRIHCFGKEADALAAFCRENNIASTAHATLQESFAACTQFLAGESIVLFSPAGSSYDLFDNYQQRGDAFKKLVNELSPNSSTFSDANLFLYYYWDT